MLFWDDRKSDRYRGRYLLNSQLKQTTAMTLKVKDQLQVKAFKNIVEKPRSSLPLFLIQQFSRNVHNEAVLTYLHVCHKRGRTLGLTSRLLVDRHSFLRPRY